MLKQMKKKPNVELQSRVYDDYCTLYCIVFEFDLIAATVN